VVLRGLPYFVDYVHCHRVVSLPDLYPTLLELASLQPREIEANSLKPLLENPQLAWDKPALTTFGPGNHSIRNERWRYTRYSNGSEELCDHDNDPNEFSNLADLQEPQR
jgi:arylsulfatase A-like enzyme